MVMSVPEPVWLWLKCDSDPGMAIAAGSATCVPEHPILLVSGVIVAIAVIFIGAYLSTR